MAPRPKNGNKRRHVPILAQSRGISTSSGARAILDGAILDGASSPLQKHNGNGLVSSQKSKLLKGNKLIRRFHTLSKELSHLKAHTADGFDKQKAIEQVEAQMNALGGIERYQKASLLGQKASKGGESTAKWFSDTLAGKVEDGGLGYRESFEKESLRFRLLDVGCLRPSRYYLRSWIHIRAIDLNPTPLFSAPSLPVPSSSSSTCAPTVRVEKADLLVMRCPVTEEEKFDGLGLSLVVNFVGDAVDRVAKALFQPSITTEFSTQNLPPSLLFLVLPSPCVLNSRYLDSQLLVDMMSHLGFDLDRRKVSRGEDSNVKGVGETKQAKRGKGGSGLVYYVFAWRRWGAGWERLAAREAELKTNGARIEEGGMEKTVVLPPPKFPKTQTVREPSPLTSEIVQQFALGEIGPSRQSLAWIPIGIQTFLLIPFLFTSALQLPKGKVFRDNEKHISSICFDDTVICLEKTSFSRKYGCSLARFTHRANNIIHASTKEDNAIRYLSFHDNRYLKYFQGHKTRVLCIDMAPADDHFISGSDDDSIRLWDLRTGKCQAVINIAGFGRPTAAYDPSGKVLGVCLSGPRGNSIRLYDVANLGTGPFATWDSPDPYSPPPLHPIITSLKFSNDGKMLLLSTNQSFLYLHDAFSLELIRRLEGLENGATIELEGDFTPDAKFVTCGESLKSAASFEVDWQLAS
ncbi:member of Set1p complex, histone methyl transferase [Gonapodya sp. JEL0774]|nr:member of Set1p complex, histone methyl transferase [Gonapodya sp. JEL0774]